MTWNPKRFHKKKKKKTVRINKFKKAAGYKVNIQRPVVFIFFQILFIYLTGREKARAGGVSERRRSRPSLSGEPNTGLDPRTLGSWPEQKADASPMEPPRWPNFLHFCILMTHFRKEKLKKQCHLQLHQKKNLGIKVTNNEKDIVHSTHGRKEMKNMCVEGGRMYGSKIWKATQTNGSIRHAP